MRCRTSLVVKPILTTPGMKGFAAMYIHPSWRGPVWASVVLDNLLVILGILFDALGIGVGCSLRRGSSSKCPLSRSCFMRTKISSSSAASSCPQMLEASSRTSSIVPVRKRPAIMDFTTSIPRVLDGPTLFLDVRKFSSNCLGSDGKYTPSVFSTSPSSGPMPGVLRSSSPGRETNFLDVPLTCVAYSQCVEGSAVDAMGPFTAPHAP